MTHPDHDRSRRALLKGALALTLAGQLPAWRASAAPVGSLAGSTADRVTLADGLRHDVLLRWGDPLFRDAPALDARLSQAADLLALRPGVAARQFGYNCDAVQYFALQQSSRHGLVCVNHEYTSEDLFFPGMPNVDKPDLARMRAWALANPVAASLTQQMHGVSVAEIARDARGRWRAVDNSRYARRITGTTPCEIRGPARGHPLLKTGADPAAVMVLGTLGNCAAGQTPWGTYLTAEENVNKFFGNGTAYGTLDPRLREAHRRLRTEHASSHGWEFTDRRFDLGAEPAEALRFGWIVEIDPFDPRATPVKRTALGRFKHECATTTLARDGRVVVYSGDDERFEHVYKYVSARAAHPTDRAANRDLLDEGTLYVARFDAGGRGRWLPLVHGHGPLTAANGFLDQGDVVIRARAASDLLGATPMDRPEDVVVDAGAGRVYVSLTNNTERLPASRSGSYSGRELDLGPNAANPRGPNPFGHIIELHEAGGDCGAADFEWEILLMGGAKSSLGSPDNLALGRDGRLWVVTDGDQPNGANDGCYVVDTRGPERGRVSQVMSAPVGAEVCGCEFTPDGRTLFLSVQHPGEGGSAERPRSTWPDGPGYLPRPSVIAVTREDGEPL
ncbi:MAG: PhoX family phosphatase [Gammaproteobacteria bacterium]|nr:PhoX family phosphatase [Gammaproteobacteria bacterium]